MTGAWSLLKRNPNYRRLWIGQVITDAGDHFNNIAVFSLAYEATHSGMVVTGIMLARALPVILAGPAAGVMLDRFDRRRIMIWSDLVRFVFALGFVFTVGREDSWLIYALSGLLMFASPFFTSGRQAILPAIVGQKDLHTANALTQMTRYMTVAAGSLAGGASVAQIGYEAAFVANALTFLVSAWAVAGMVLPEGGFKPKREPLPEDDVIRPWHDYVEGLRYIRAHPMVAGIACTYVGWATGGGAAQILFTLFGEQVFQRGASGIGTLWGFAGIGLVAGSAVGHWLGKRLLFPAYKHTVSIALLIHGGAYVAFSLMESYAAALLFIALSRAGMAVTTVLHVSHLLHHVPDRFMGRVFATLESLVWFTMLFSLTLAGIASDTYTPREIGVGAGILSSTTAIFWAAANWLRMLPEPPRLATDRDEAEAPPIRPVRAG